MHEHKSLLLAATVAAAMVPLWNAHAGSSYLAVWASDKETDDNKLNRDFLAIIDADPRSTTYGKVAAAAAKANVMAAASTTAPVSTVQG